MLYVVAPEVPSGHLNSLNLNYSQAFIIKIDLCLPWRYSEHRFQVEKLIIYIFCTVSKNYDKTEAF